MSEAENDGNNVQIYRKGTLVTQNTLLGSHKQYLTKYDNSENKKSKTKTWFRIEH